MAGHTSIAVCLCTQMVAGVCKAADPVGRAAAAGWISAALAVGLSPRSWITKRA